MRHIKLENLDEQQALVMGHWVLTLNSKWWRDHPPLSLMIVSANGEYREKFDSWDVHLRVGRTPVHAAEIYARTNWNWFEPYVIAAG